MRDGEVAEEETVVAGQSGGCGGEVIELAGLVVSWTCGRDREGGMESVRSGCRSCRSREGVSSWGRWARGRSSLDGGRGGRGWRGRMKRAEM